MVNPLVALGALEKGMGGLAKGVDKLTQAVEGAFNKSIGFGDRAQKASLELGMTYTTAQAKFSSSVEGLRGDLSTKMMGAFMALEAGLHGNTAGVTKLINQQMLTGTAFAKTAPTFAALHKVLGLSEEATNSLAVNLLEVNDTYNISTEVLVNSLNNLSKSFPAMRLMGMGQQVTEAMVKLQGELGTAMAGPLEAVMGSIMDTSIEGFQKLTMLGIGGVREQLAAATTTAQAVEILRDAFTTAGVKIENFTAGSDKFALMVGIAERMFGQHNLHFPALAEALENSIEKDATTKVDFARTMETLRAEVWTPLYEVISFKLFPTVLDVTETFSQLGQAITKTMGDFIDKRIPEIEVSMRGIVIFIMETLVTVFDMAQNFWVSFKGIWESVIPTLKFLVTTSALLADVFSRLVLIATAGSRGKLGLVKGIWKQITGGGTIADEVGAAMEASQRDLLAAFTTRGMIGELLGVGEEGSWAKTFIIPTLEAFKEGLALEREGLEVMRDIAGDTRTLVRESASDRVRAEAEDLARHAEFFLGLPGAGSGESDRLSEYQIDILQSIDTSLEHMRMVPSTGNPY